jgi:hypothetical protein
MVYACLRVVERASFHLVGKGMDGLGEDVGRTWILE